ncbi:hypothetical protein HDG32_004437 [Paraburkholderia sp. CI2]|nr:hypothetical protein [Paraburkholderia sp. CI2]
MKNARTVPRVPDRLVAHRLLSSLYPKSRRKRGESVPQNAFFQAPAYTISASAAR